LSEHAQDVDTTRMEEELDQSQRLIDEAKERAAELAEASPDPYHAEDRQHEAEGVDPFGGTRDQGVEAPEGSER
jgi:hypothetical protein